MKKSNLKPCLLCISLLFAANLLAQKEGKFILTVYTPDAYVKIDSLPMEKMAIDRQQMYTLTEGVHQLQIWSSGHDLYKDTVHIVASGLKQRRVNLTRTAEFVKFRDQNGNSALQKAMNVGSKIFLIGANIGLTWLVIYEGKERPNEKLALMKESKFYYENSYSIDALPDLKNEFYFYQSEYSNSIKYYNIKLIVGIPLTLAAYYGTYRVFRKINKNRKKRPVFNDQNPLSKTQYELNPVFDLTSTGSFGLNLNIKF
jgi:ACT domain-containing protein